MMIFFILLSILLTLFYYHLAVKPFSYWSDKKVRTGKLIPFFGDNFGMFFGTEALYEMILRMYNTYPNGRYIGAYLFSTPLLVLKSPALIKQICVKDFDHFHDHRSLVPNEVDDLWSRNLVALTGEEWTHMRSTLTPSFTGSKLRSMFVHIRQNAKLFSEYFIKKDNDEIIEIEFKDAFGRYSSDVIASAAFGIKVDSLFEEENNFYVIGKVASFYTPYTRMVFFLYQIVPIIGRIFRIPLVKKKVRNFFIETVRTSIKMRRESGIERSDMLAVLMNQKNKNNQGNTYEKGSYKINEELKVKKKANDELNAIDIAAQVLIFYLGGFEVVSNAMCYLAYELALNPDIQEELIKEIDENRPQNDELSYDKIMKMNYLDMVVNETLRKWPVTVAVDRVVTKPYTITPESPDEEPIELEKDVNVAVPIIALHRDPKYYPDPLKFDPERFSVKNKKSITPYTYLPFGVGPRNCIGSRFALLEIKAVFFFILLHFRIVPVAKTEIPLKMNKSSLNIIPKNGFNLGLKRRH